MATDLTERGPERFNCKAQAGKLDVGEAGATIEELLDWFEGVEDWQVRSVLKHLESSLLEDLKIETAV